jgi:hypothetical protein
VGIKQTIRNKTALGTAIKGNGIAVIESTVLTRSHLPIKNECLNHKIIEANQASGKSSLGDRTKKD